MATAGHLARSMLLEDHQSLPLSHPARRVGWTRRLRRVAVVIVALAVFGAWVWVEREPLLRGAAELWIVSDAVSPADAAVVLGGGSMCGRLQRPSYIGRVGQDGPGVAGGR
jgi:hypothetical protein